MSDIQEEMKKQYKRAEENDIKLLQEEIEYEQHCNEQLRNKITNLEYKIKRLEEDNKYKEVIDKIKEYCKEETIDNREYRDVAYRDALNNILELLEEIE